MVADGRVEQGPQRDNYLAWGLFQVVTRLGRLHGTPVLLSRGLYPLVNKVFPSRSCTELIE
jgi:hypothetical protein